MSQNASGHEFHEQKGQLQYVDSLLIMASGQKLERAM
jgi:hypothetical protein